MKHFIYNLLAFFITCSCIAQDVTVDQKDSYKRFVETLENSKDLRYNDILSLYDTHIVTNPEDVITRVYKCRFIGNAYYDAYEDYNLKYDETLSCIDQLYTEFPKHPEVLIYKLENTYSEEKEDLLYEAMNVYNSNKKDWTYQQISSLYEMASLYYVEDDDFKAITYADKAVRYSDSLDLSVLLTKAHMRTGNVEEAKQRLLGALYYDNDAWKLQQKGELLIELGEVDEALKMFDRVTEKDSTYVNNDNLYKVFIQTKDYELARSYLVKDTINEWNKTEGIQKLLNHDLSHSSSVTALISYRRMQELSYYDDFFGIKRLRLFVKAPFKSWTFNELSHILILFALIIVLFLFPYVWILPIYSANKVFKIKPISSDKLIPVNWTLKHFWLISFVYLICQIFLGFVFYYQDYMNFLFDIVYTYMEEELLESQAIIANTLITYALSVFILTLLFLNRKRLKFVFHTDLSYLKVVILSIGFLITNMFVLKILRGFIDLDEAASFMEVLSMREDMQALLFEHGFGVSVLIVAVIVPFYEEIMFRGIILSSIEKYLGFKWANSIQAVLFAIVHFNLGLSIFYILFGLITGLAVKRTNGLLTGMVFHAVNNFVVLLALYMMSRILPNMY